MKLERDIEQRLKKEVERIGGLCLKFTSPSNSGVPDRLVLFQGFTCFVEVKRPGKQLRPLQEHWQAKIMSHGVMSATVSTEREVDDLVQWIQLGRWRV